MGHVCNLLPYGNTSRIWGYETEIIDLHRPHQADYVASKRFTRSRETQGYCLRAIKGKLKKILGLSRPHRHLSDSAQAKFDAFNSQIRLSQPYRSIDYLYDNPPVYDIYISGSDQLWNPDQPFCLEPYFLTFAPQGKRKVVLCVQRRHNKADRTREGLFRGMA